TGHSGPGRQLERSRTKCPSCSKPMSKVPTKKVKKGFFLKCEAGCKTGDDKDLVLFWSERVKQWQLPQPKTELPTETKLTEYPCPVCGKPLEEYHYSKEGQAKSMLRCSDAKARSNAKHKDVAYFRGKEGNWWSPKLGDLKSETKLDQK
ncbi:MAG: DNA topoisomerase I, partial [Thermosynechococcaceae cyanobacterium]